MDTRTRKRMGIALVVICMIVLVLVGFSDWPEAVSATPMQTSSREATASARIPVCDNCSTVSTRREGARKFRHGVLGHAPRRIQYSPKLRRIIVDKLQRKLNSSTARTSALSPGGGYWTRAEVWQKFTREDRCVVQRYGTSTSNATYKCSSRATATNNWVANYDVKPWQVRVAVCGGVTGIGIGGALAAGATGPWTWVGLGAAFAACQWGPWLESQAAN